MDARASIYRSSQELIKVGADITTVGYMASLGIETPTDVLGTKLKAEQLKPGTHAA
jgi:hypothetical protein